MSLPGTTDGHEKGGQENINLTFSCRLRNEKECAAALSKTTADSGVW